MVLVDAPSKSDDESGSDEMAQNPSSSKPEKVWAEQSIYKVPNFLKILNEKAYKPLMVSFGPYHHDDTMKDHKERALSQFLDRMGKTREDCSSDMEPIIKAAASCYSELEEKWEKEPEKFLDMLILDGCFMLEVINIFHGLSSDYSADDPIFSAHGQLYNFPVIRRDMLLIENQIPFLVLQKLMEFKRKPPKTGLRKRAHDTSRGFGVAAQDQENLNKLILQFCTLRESKTDIGNCLHVLDIYRKGLLRNPSRPTAQPMTGNTYVSSQPPNSAPSPPPPPPPPPQTTSMSTIRCAEQLHEAGIEFQTSSNYLDDISFNDGILTLPVLVVDDATESTFLNLVAFERLHVGAGNDVTSYVFFMDNLINSANDVSLLSEKRIVLSIIGSDEDVAEIFNKLSNELTINPDNSLREVREKIRLHCEQKFNRWRANLLHNYFKSPWTIISLVIACVYLVLTVLQTNFAIMDFYKPDDKSPSPVVDHVVWAWEFGNKTIEKKKRKWTEDLRLDMEQYTQQTEVWERHSIYKVPTYLSNLNQTAYEPQVVSFGPYHCEDQQCKPMHEHKVRACTKFLNRACKPVEPYKKALGVVIDQLRESYDNLDTKWQNDENDDFMDLMILDGTFMLEILNSTTDKYNDYHPNDPIFGAHGKHFILPFIRRDMLLIENQIPMLVLETLIAVRDSTLPEQGKKTEDAQSSGMQMHACKQSHTPSVVVDIPIIKTPRSVGENQELKRLVVEFFYQTNVVPEKPSLHLLDLYRKSHPLLDYVKCEKSKPLTAGKTSEIIRSATELKDAGVGFEFLKNEGNINSIKFNKGVLFLPKFTVDDHTESTFLNLMAFERLHVGAGNQISSYICFMDNLIDSALDVAILQKKGIIQNATGSDKAVASLFNQLSKEVPLDSGNSLDQVKQEVNKHCEQTWNHYRASLVQRYFQSPWASISLGVAIFLLVLTITQSVYSILDFYKK
ncbi:uncharacterized protein [Aristolochia californica]|uniref:uncharacterized protein n=1 Tax=Aristolochia californica TaxID=171875 RepID=UPI0035E3240F